MVDLESPVQTYPCSHICRYGMALTWSDRVLFHRYLQRGKVMRARYPGLVGGDNLVSPFELYGTRSPFGTVCWPRRWQVSRGDTGATQGRTPGENECRWYDGRVTGQAGLIGAMLVHPNGITRSVLHSVGKVRNLCGVSNLFE